MCNDVSCTGRARGRPRPSSSRPPRRRRGGVPTDPRTRADNAKAWRLLGAICLEADRLEEGEESFRRALELQPDDAATQHALAERSRSSQASRGGDGLPTGARARPRPRGGVHHPGQDLPEKRRWVEAESALETVFRLDPRDPKAHETLGMVLVDQGRPAEALGQPRGSGAATAGRRLQTRRLLAYALMQLGRFADAEAEAREALRLRPGWVKAYSLLNVITGFESEIPISARSRQWPGRRRAAVNGARRSVLHTRKVLRQERCLRPRIRAPLHRERARTRALELRRRGRGTGR